MTNPTFDSSQISSFIKALHDAAMPLQGNGKLCVACIPAGGNSTPFIEMFDIGDDKKAVEWILDHQAVGYNFYAPLAVYSPDSTERKTENIRAVLGLVADFDDENAIEYRERLPALPDYVTETSAGRFQAGYIFDKPQTDMKAVSIAAKGLQQTAACDSCTSNINQLWRIPGTVNYPNAAKIKAGRNPEGCVATFTEEIGEASRTDFGQFSKKLPELIVEKPAPAEPVDFTSIGNDRLDALEGSLPKFLKGLLTQSPNEGERSEHIFHVLACLKEHGITSGEAYGLSLKYQSGGFISKHNGHDDRIQAEIKRVYGKVASAPPVAQSSAKLFYRPSEVMAFPCPQYLIEGVLPKNSLVCITGEPGSGKSLLVLDWLLHIASGKDWYGIPTEQGQVLYVSTEGGFGIKARMTAWQKHYGVTVPESEFGICPKEFVVTEKDALENLTDAIEDAGKAYGPVKVLVLDTVARTMAGDENTSEAMTSYIRCVSGLVKKYGLTVILVHHTTKNASAESGASKFRGHSSLYGALDVGISLKKNDFIHTMRMEKIKDDEAINDLIFERTQIDLSAELGFYRSGKPYSSAVLVPSKVLLSALGGSSSLPTKDELVREAILEYLEMNGASRTRDIINGLASVMGNSSVAAREASFGRAARALQELGQIKSIKKGTWGIAKSMVTFVGGSLSDIIRITSTRH